MMNYNRLTEQTRMEFDLQKLINVDNERTLKQLAEAATMARNWRDGLTNKHSVSNVTDDEEQFATMTFNAWLRDERIDKPVIIAAPPAFGKSAMLAEFLKTMTVHYPDTFGAVVVKERLDDLKALRDEINKVCGVKRAYLIEGYDADSMTRLEYSEQFHRQREYNVLLMTTKQLERQSMRDNLHEFTGYINEKGKSARRSLLLIDEKPSLVLSHTLSARNINEFMSDVLDVSRDVRGKLKPYYNRVRQVVDELRSILENPETKAGEFKAINRAFRIPVQLVRDFAEHFGHDEMATLRAVEKVINAGGEYGNGIVTSTHVVHYKYTLFHTYILDGTGASDPEYMSDDFYMVQPENVLDYSNVLFRVCNTYSLSKTALRQSAQTVEEIIKMTKRIIANHAGEKTLVVSYKENVEEIEEQLAEEIIAGKVRVKHFDGGRGSNEYVDCNNAIYIGTLFKGTDYYATAAQAVIGDRLGKELERGHTMTSAGLTFNDEYAEGYKKTDIAINLVQETNRLRAGRKPDNVTIYLFNRDAEMIDIVQKHYPLAKYEEYEPLERLTGKREAIDKIVDYFAGMEQGARVKQSAIYKELEISSRTFRRQSESIKFQSAMEKYGITKEKTFYQKGNN